MLLDRLNRIVNPEVISKIDAFPSQSFEELDEGGLIQIVAFEILKPSKDLIRGFPFH